MIWPNLNSLAAYQGLKAYCEANKDQEALGFDSGGQRKSKFVVFQCWAMIQRIRNVEVSNPNIISTFNAESKGAKGTPDTRTMELVWSYGKTLLAGCAGIQAALRHRPQIADRTMPVYQQLIVDLTRAGISVKAMREAVIAYEPEVLKSCHEIYELWDRWQSDIFREEALTLISNPDSLKDLANLRKRQKEALDGSGLFKSNARASGKFKLLPRAKDGLPLIVFSPSADIDISTDVDEKVDQFSSQVKTVRFNGKFRQSGNLKIITFSFNSNPASVDQLRVALQSINVIRSIDIEPWTSGGATD